MYWGKTLVIGNSRKDYCTMYYSEQVNSDREIPWAILVGVLQEGPRTLAVLRIEI